MAKIDSVETPINTLTELHSIEDLPADMPEGVAKFCNYWFKHGDDRGTLSRDLFDPIDFAPYLHGVLLLEYEGRGETGEAVYRYRLAGDTEVRNRGFNPTGMLLKDGVFFVDYERALAGYEQVRKTGHPHHARARFRSDRGIMFSEVAIVLPLTTSNGPVDQILVYSEAAEEE